MGHVVKDIARVGVVRGSMARSNTLLPALGAMTVLSLGFAVFVLLRGETEIPDEQLADHGQPCKVFDCRRPYHCSEGVCATGDEIRARTEARLAKEATATALPPVAGAGGRVPFSVKVRRSSDGGESFAQCAADERLVGGGCDGSVVIRTITSAPEGFSEQDTLGARWRCNSQYTAYALCMWVPATLAAPRP